MAKDSEEVAALLFGTFEGGENQGNARKGENIRDRNVYVANVKSVYLMPRKQGSKQNDRVEIDAEILSFAIQKAEIQGLQVIGWMHSHPKITIWPSWLDLRTQLSFQTLDSKFIGLIYSAFDQNINKGQRVQLIAFQAIKVLDETQRVDIEVEIVDLISKSNLSQIPKNHILDVAETFLVEELITSQKANIPCLDDPIPNHLSTISRIKASSARIAEIQAVLILPVLHFRNNYCTDN